MKYICTNNRQQLTTSGWRVLYPGVGEGVLYKVTLLHTILTENVPLSYSSD